MTETSTLTVNQELFNRLGTQHPGKQILKVLERVEKLEALHINPHCGEPVVSKVEGKDALTRSEKMKAAWAKRKANAKV